MSRSAASLLACATLLVSCGAGESRLQLSIELRTRQDGVDCFIPCRGAPAPSPDLKLDRCADATPVECDLTAGTSVVRLVADYGSFSVSAAPPPATFTVRLDGKDTPVPGLTPGSPSQSQTTGEPRWFSQQVFAIPAASAREARFLAAVTPTYTAEIDHTFAVAPPEPALTAGGCAPGGTCAPLAAGVGRVEVSVIAPQNLTETAAVVDAYRQDTLAATTAPVTVPFADETARKRALTTVEVPAFEGTWIVRARIAGYAPLEVAIPLAFGAFTASVDPCADQTRCTFPASTGSATWTVTTPPNFNVTKATVGALLDGELVTPATEVTLDAAGTRKLLQRAFPVPDREGTWQLRAAFGPDKIVTSTITVTTPALGFAVTQCAGGGGGCTRAAGVGSVDVVVTAPERFTGPVPQISTTLDGMPATPLQSSAWQLRNGELQSTLRVRVPEFGTLWRLSAGAGRFSAKPEVTITLQPPAVNARLLECKGASPCQRTSGSAITLFVDAPADLFTTQVTVRTLVDSIPVQGADAQVVLSTVAMDRRSALVPRTVTAQPGHTWQLEVIAGQWSYFSEQVAAQ